MSHLTNILWNLQFIKHIYSITGLIYQGTCGNFLIINWIIWMFSGKKIPLCLSLTRKIHLHIECGSLDMLIPQIFYSVTCVTKSILFGKNSQGSEIKYASTCGIEILFMLNPTNRDNTFFIIIYSNNSGVVLFERSVI